MKDKGPNEKDPGLTPRLFLVALIFIPVNTYLLLQMELVRYTFPTWIVPLSNVIFTLTVVMVVNALIRQVTPRIALRHGELGVFYVMLSITTTLSAGDMLQSVLSALGYAFWFATPENEFKELFFRFIPRWLTVSDETALQDFYEGESTLYVAHYLKVWIPVVLAWLLFFTVLAFNFLCLNTILRRQWTEHERLTYPIAQLALEMTSPTAGFFRNKRMWIGFGNRRGHLPDERAKFYFSRRADHPGQAQIFRIRRRSFGAVFRLQRPDTHLVLSLRHWHPLPYAAGNAFFYGILLRLEPGRTRAGASHGVG